MLQMSLINFNPPCICGCPLENHYPFDGKHLENLEQWCGSMVYCGCTNYGYKADNLKYLEMISKEKEVADLNKI